MRNDETMGTFEYDGLIIDGSHSLDVKGTRKRSSSEPKTAPLPSTLLTASSLTM